MTSRFVLVVAAGLAWGWAGPGAADTFTATDTPRPIPDGPSTSGETRSQVAIALGPGACPIPDLNVFVDLVHTDVGDLELSLTHVETGTVVRLYDNEVSNGENIGNTTFDDEASTPIGDGVPPYGAGPYVPDQPLSAFDGESPDGTWVLRVLDQASGDTGTLNAFAVEIDFTVDLDGDGQPDCVDADDDDDGVLDDGDGSGIIGDHPCSAGQVDGCDDNCRTVVNPLQQDGNGNGIGVVCDADCSVFVGAEPGSDYPTIAAALAAEIPGDPGGLVVRDGCTVHVHPGSYASPLVLDRNIRLLAVDASPAATVIDGGDALAVIEIPDAPGRFVEIDGFTIANGVIGIDGRESFRLADSIVGPVTTVAIRVDTLESAGIERCVVRGGSDAGLLLLGNADVVNTLFEGGTDCVRLESGGTATLEFSTITACSVGVLQLAPAPFDLELRDSIVWGNASADLVGVDCASVVRTDTDPACCSVNGNLCADPLFAAPGSGNYRPSVGSPVVDSGFGLPSYPGKPVTDLDAMSPRPERLLDGDGDYQVHADMGAYELFDAGLLPGDIENVRFRKNVNGTTALRWDADPDVEAAGGVYHVYRGAISEIGFDDMGDCDAVVDEVSAFEGTFVETDTPAPGTGFFHLVTGVTGVREGTLGYATGTERNRYAACEFPDFKRVFVTSTTQNANLGGISGADAICNQRAAEAGLPGTYKAWLSDVSTSPSTSFARSSVPYLRTDGRLIALDWDDLTDGFLFAAIRIDESGADPGIATAWTATGTDGTYNGAYNCDNWTRDAPVGKLGAPVGVGRTSSTGFDWTATTFGPFGGDCSSTVALYCFEQ